MVAELFKVYYYWRESIYHIPSKREYINTNPFNRYKNKKINRNATDPIIWRLGPKIFKPVFQTVKPTYVVYY